MVTIPKNDLRRPGATMSVPPRKFLLGRTSGCAFGGFQTAQSRKYNYSVDDLNKLYGNLRAIAVDAGC